MARYGAILIRVREFRAGIRLSDSVVMMWSMWIVQDDKNPARRILVRYEQDAGGPVRGVARGVDGAVGLGPGLDANHWAYSGIGRGDGRTS